MNTASLIGRLTRDPESLTTPSGTEISKFSLAVDRAGDRQDDGTTEAGFFDIVCWGKTAEIANQYLTKGRQVGITGRLLHHRWEAQGDGGKRSRVEIHCDPYGLTLISDGKRDGDGDTRFTPSGRNQPGDNVGEGASAASDADDFGGADDDIPF